MTESELIEQLSTMSILDLKRLHDWIVDEIKRKSNSE
jgi:hypothetical protein